MRKRFALAAVLAAVPHVASATDNGLSYTWLEGGYVGSRYDLHTATLDPATGSFDTRVDTRTADGWAVRGAVAIAPNFHLFGSYITQDYPITDAEEWRVGVGYHHGISSKADLLTGVAYQRSGDDFSSHDGWSVEAGVRAGLTRHIEGYLLAGYQDYDGGIDGEFYGRLGAQVKFNPMWGISAEVMSSDGDNRFFIGPRASF